MSYEDRVALADLFNCYAAALDRKRWYLLGEVFTEDVTTIWPGGTIVSGRTEVIAMITGFLGGGDIRTHHMVGNFAALIDGDRAETSVYSRAVHQGVGEKEGVLDESLGVFDATARRTGAGWRFERFSQDVLVKVRTGSLFNGEP